MGPRAVLIYPAFVIGAFSRFYVIDGNVERELKLNTWTDVSVTSAASIGCTNRTLDWRSIARRNGTRLPVHATAIVYRPDWLHPRRSRERPTHTIPMTVQYARGFGRFRHHRGDSGGLLVHWSPRVAWSAHTVFASSSDRQPARLPASFSADEVHEFGSAW